jgi:hypothetical protein
MLLSVHPCSLRRALLDLLNRHIHTLGSFAVILVEWSRPLKEFMVHANNAETEPILGSIHGLI